MSLIRKQSLSLIAGVLALVSAPVVLAQDTSQSLSVIETIDAPSNDEIVLSDPDVLRSLPITVDLELLRGADPAAGIHFEVPLFDDVRLLASVQDLTLLGGQDFSCFGKLDDHPFSSFVLAGDGTSLYGNFRSVTHGTYQVRMTGHGTQVLRHVQLGPMGLCGNGSAGAPAFGGDPASAAQYGGADTGDTIDVMVVYTPLAEALTVANLFTTINNLINVGIADMNMRMANSGVNPRMRLVHRQSLTTNESGNSIADRAALQGTADGLWDEVHGWRSEYRADLVHLIVGVTSPGLGGLAFLPQYQSHLSSGTYSFGLTKYNSVAGGTMAHELGHNLGCHHHPADADASGGTIAGDVDTLFPYTFGHRPVLGVSTFYTTMAYPVPGSFAIPSFSNPDQLIGGIPTGTPEQRDNSRTIDDTALQISNYTESVNYVLPGGVLFADGSHNSPYTSLVEGLANSPPGNALRIIDDSPYTGVISSPIVLEANDLIGNPIIIIGQ